MHKFKSVLICLAGMLIIISCTYSQDKDQQRAQELITVRTLGLAYLEEFQLEDAEKQFLRLIKLAPREKLGYAISA
jgi:Tfp pilus assembly protein PilF